MRSGWRSLEVVRAAARPVPRGAGVLEQAHVASGVKRSYIVIAAVMSLISFIFFGFGANFLINVIGFTWPAYQTFKALETTEVTADDKFW